MNVFFENFVAVVDSGVGGLTVLSKLRRDYPRCNYLYFADGAYCPYGTRSDDNIFSRLTVVFDWLVEQRVSAVVLACNTASVFAPRLRRRFDVPIFDVIAPTCCLAARTTRNKRVALLATDATVRSGVYGRLLADYGVVTSSYPCSALVPFAERGETHSAECKRAVRLALKDLGKSQADTVVLGCTHFPLLRHAIEPYAGGAAIVQCETDFAPSDNARGNGTALYVTTGAAPQKSASAVCSEARFAHIDLRS